MSLCDVSCSLDTTSVMKCKVCKKEATNICSACKEVAYCSKEHQKAHWKKHKSNCKNYEVKYTPELGNHLLATHDLEAESIIFKDVPIIVGPKIHDDCTKVICLTCYTVLTEKCTYRCPRCTWPLCGPKCSGDRKAHDAECEVFEANGPNEGPFDETCGKYQSLLPLRCLLTQRNDSKKWKKIEKMESHESRRGPNTETYNDIQGRIVNYLRPLLDKYEEKLKEENKPLFADRSDAMIHRICGILDVNSHEIQLPCETEVLALYPTAYLLEHSCVPNTSHTYDILEDSKQCRMILRTIKHVKKGEHLSTMYTNILWSTMARREHLSSTKYFICRCERCMDPTEFGTYLGTILCRGAQLLLQYDSPAECLAYYEHTRNMPLPSCTGSLLPVNTNDDSPWKCNRCNTTMQAFQVESVCSSLGAEVQIALTVPLSISIYEALLSKLSIFLHPNHYHCFQVKHSLIQMYGRKPGYMYPDLSEDMVDKKVRMCREMIALIQMIDPTHARLSLYTAALLIEQHFALIHLATKQVKANPQTLTPMEACLRGLEAKSLLKRAQTVLSHEPIHTVGYKLLDPITTFIRDIDAWMKQMKPTL